MTDKVDYRNPMVRGRVVKHVEESHHTSMNIYTDLKHQGSKNYGEGSTAEKKIASSLDQNPKR